MLGNREEPLQAGGCHHGVETGHATGWGSQGEKMLGDCEAFGGPQADEIMELARGMQ